MIVSQGMSMASAGLGIGILAAIPLVHLLPSFSHLLYGVNQSDPLTLFCVSAVLLLVAATACYLPARRAMRTNPMNSLRCE
jgi:ABC-type antimicrobial peptide transport system permease subunit